ncbi:autotransporter outer membrane beta-barrel domain-containing protein [Brucella pseudogrignonensis]
MYFKVSRCSALLAGVSAITLLCTAPLRAADYIIDNGASETVPGDHPTSWELSSDVLKVGNTSSGTLRITSGAQVVPQFTIIGAGPGSTGTIIIDGPGSSLSDNTRYYNTIIGDQGNGTLIIQNGGSAIFQNANVGGQFNSNGKVVVDGAGSSLFVKNSFDVGQNGTGALEIRNGGYVSTTSAGIGNIHNGIAGKGTVLLTGEGSLWEDGGNLDIGGSAVGVLTIADGARADFNILTLGRSRDGTLNIGGATGEPAAAAGVLGAHSIVFGNGSAQINFNHVGAPFILSAALANAVQGGTTGNINQISGTTILTGNNSSFGGTVNITGGVLQVGNDGITGDLGRAQISTGKDTTNKGVLSFGRSDVVSIDNIIKGTGSVLQHGSGVTVLRSANTYTGGTDLESGVLSIGSDSNLGDASGGLRFAGGTLLASDSFTTARLSTLSSSGGTVSVANNKTLTLAGEITNLGAAHGALTKTGDGTLVLTAQNSYSGGTTIAAGTLQLGDGTTGHDGSIIGNIVNNASLVVANLGDMQLAGDISGTGSLTQSGTGVLTLSGNSDYTGGTQLLGGTVSVAQEESLGNITGALNFDGGTLQVTGTDFKTTTRSINWGNQGGGFDIVDANNSFTVTSAFSGAGALAKTGAGALILTADSFGYSGSVDVQAGDLRLDGATLGGSVTVEDQADLGGHGTIAGATTLASGATLFGQSGQQMHFSNGLILASGSQTDVTLSGGQSTNALFDVTGDLALDGTLNVDTGSAVGVGVYRIFDYSGALTANTMTIGTVPGNSADYSLQTSITHEVNLINAGGRQFFFWDGSQMSGDGTVHGGDGTWNNLNSNWTSADGTGNTPWFDDTFAVFGGTAGIVTIDAGFTPAVNGMQFMNDGYVLTGGSLSLAGVGDQLILVGDGSLQSSSMTATIASVIEGNEGLLKSGAGQLVLSGANSYTGTTTVTEGLLTLGEGGSIDPSSAIVLASTRYGTGAFAINKNADFPLLNQISGLGAVYKRGTGITTFSGDNSFSGGLNVEAGTAKAGIADHAFGAGLVTIADGAILDLADLNETIGGLDGLNPADGHGHDGNITLGSGTLTLNQDLHGDYSGTISGSGGIVKNGAGDLVLYGANSYAGITNVTAGDLVQGAQGSFSQASSYQVQDGGVLDLSGFATAMTGLQNGGMVSFGGTGGTVLTVNGDYVGTGGTLMMSTVLGGDSAQTDQLVITGNSAGNSKVSISNRGGLGAQTINGIKIIDIGGQSNGSFTLNGDYTTKDGQQAILTSSAFAYTLQKGSGSGNKDGNWYLVSQNTRATDPTDPVDPTGPRYSAAAPVYESYNATLQSLNRLPTLQQRVGDRYWDNAANTASTNAGETTPAGIWGRIEGAHNRIQSGSTAGDVNQNINTVILQAGVDGQFYENEQGRLIAGITGQYGNAHARIDNLTGDGSGEINTEGWGLGATATIYGRNGFYLDAQAEANWYDSDLDVDAVNRGLVHSNKGFGYALSLEAGQRITLNESWSLTPQAQLMWSSVDFDSFTDAYGARISSHEGDSLTGRIGLAANYQDSFTGTDGRKVDTSLYGIANLYQALIGENRIDYAGTRMATDDDRSWGGIGMGGTYQWADAKYALYGEATINTALNHFADSYTIKGNVGFKVKW